LLQRLIVTVVVATVVEVLSADQLPTTRNVCVVLNLDGSYRLTLILRNDQAYS
jgi:hypothetical protein